MDPFNPENVGFVVRGFGKEGTPLYVKSHRHEHMLTEEEKTKSIEVFTQLYRDVLIKRCKIKVEEIRDDGTYVLVTFTQPRLTLTKRWFRSDIKCHYYLSPGRASLSDYDNGY